MRYLFLLLGLLFTNNIFSQLGFCEGSKGDPIFEEDFSSSNALPPGTTNYRYVTGQDPQDGEYRITNEIGNEIGGWHTSLPQTTVSKGNALVVNADYTAGRFFKTEISGLCENTSYEFSAFLINILAADNTCENGGIPINVKFEIWDETDSELLAEGNTGDIHASNAPKWEQYALTFQSEPGQHSVILKMFNNGEGGCGNDLAIDDITFSSCGDLTEIQSGEISDSRLDLCEPDAPVSRELTAIPDFSVYQNHAFQWQESSNNEDWQDIPGENSSQYTTPELNISRFYRVKVAEDQVNLDNNRCNSVSEPFHINIVETPSIPLSEGDQQVCSNETIPALRVEVAEDESVDWYASETGGEALEENSTSFTPEEAGVYYAQAVKTGFNCSAGERTAVRLEIFQEPQVEDEQHQICEDSALELDAGVEGTAYIWNTGESSRKISITSPGLYSLTIINSNGCSAEKIFEVTGVDVAEIEEISSEENLVIIKPAREGDFEYSLDGNNFQASNEFEVSGGVYTAYIRDRAGCNIVSEEFPHIVVPTFITPNGDGYNDEFRINGLEFFSRSHIRIYDRYGKLLKSGNGEDFRWDGTANGRALPADDYWYEVKMEHFPSRKGNFSLKR